MIVILWWTLSYTSDAMVTVNKDVSMYTRINLHDFYKFINEDIAPLLG